MDIVRGLSIRLKDVSVKSRFAEEPELKARSVWVVVRLLPLLSKQVEVKENYYSGGISQDGPRCQGAGQFREPKTMD